MPSLVTCSQTANRLRQKLKAANEARFIASIFIAEQNRKNMLNDCLLYAEWAATDLQKWEKVFVRFRGEPKKLKIIDGKIASAHCKFAHILAETQNLEEIGEYCGKDPFLLREKTILQRKLEEYYASQKDAEKFNETVNNAAAKNGEKDQGKEAASHIGPRL